MISIKKMGLLRRKESKYPRVSFDDMPDEPEQDVVQLLNSRDSRKKSNDDVMAEIEELKRKIAETQKGMDRPAPPIMPNPRQHDLDLTSDHDEDDEPDEDEPDYEDDDVIVPKKKGRPSKPIQERQPKPLPVPQKKVIKIVKELPLQPIRSYQDENGTVIELMTMEEALEKVMNG